MVVKILIGFLGLAAVFASPWGQAGEYCDKSLSIKQSEQLFRQAALAQLRLEFGNLYLKVYDVQTRPVAGDLLAFNARVDYHKPGSGKEKSSTRVKAWVSRCQGTTIIRGNSWLADGTLSVERFSAAQLKGGALVYGRKEAPLHIIAFVDSRCSHCHRLLGYAQPLLDAGKLRLELRQVAYLESVDEAVLDTRLSETELVALGPVSVNKSAYWDLLSGFANEEPLKQEPSLEQARKIVEHNTRLAKELVKINTVPGVLVRDEGYQDYRLVGYWEMNRLLLPEN